MPRHCLPAAIVVALALALPAVCGAADLEMGVKAGLNLANFRGEFGERAGTEVKLGFVGGPFVALGVAPGLAVQAEALFSMKGAKVPDAGVDYQNGRVLAYDTFVNLDYVEVPVLLRWTPLRRAPVRPMLVAGPTLGISLGGKVATEVMGVPEQSLRHLEPLDFGVALGGGFGVALGGHRLTAEARYTTGFRDTYAVAGGAACINRVVSLTTGVTF